MKELIYSDDKQAFECYKIASELGQPSANYNMAVSLQKQGKHLEAEEYYQKCLKLSQMTKTQLFLMGCVCLRKKV